MTTLQLICLQTDGTLLNDGNAFYVVLLKTTEWTWEVVKFYMNKTNDVIVVLSSSAVQKCGAKSKEICAPHGLDCQ